MENSKLNIDVVAYDAGGAELLSSMVQHELDNYSWRLITPIDSPARVIFKRKNLSTLLYGTSAAEDIFDCWNRSKPNYLFCGTGSNGFELPFIREARRREITSVAFLDHWINYRERFGYPESDWINSKPDIFALSDNRAYTLAEKLTLGQLIKIKNYYITDLLSELDKYKLGAQNNNNLLFISEAIEEHCLVKYNDPEFEGYTQTQVLIEILDNFYNLSQKLQFENIIIRLHPAEIANKYDYLKHRYPDIGISIEKPGDRPLNECIADTKVVIGIKSMALLIAFLLNKPVLSYIPINLKCCLPLPEVCCTHDLYSIPAFENIPHFNADNELSFYEEFPLGKMLINLKEKFTDHAML